MRYLLCHALSLYALWTWLEDGHDYCIPCNYFPSIYSEASQTFFDSLVLQRIRAASSILGCLLKLLCHLASFLAFYPLSFMQICANVFIAWKFIICPALLAPLCPNSSLPSSIWAASAVFVCLSLSVSAGIASSWNARVIIFDNYRHSCGKLCAPSPSPPCFFSLNSAAAVVHLICWLAECNSCQSCGRSLSLSRLLSIICNLCRITTTIAAAAAVVAVSLLWPAATTVTLGERVYLVCYTLKTLCAAFRSV